MPRQFSPSSEGGPGSKNTADVSSNAGYQVAVGNLHGFRSLE